MVQPVGPGGGRGALRFAGDARVSSASISAASRCRTRRRCAASAICWRQHDLGRQLFDEVQRHLTAKGLKVATGTIVDATIINAPSSTKNAEKARDPEMHQTKKGNQWYFGMKAHIGVDSRTKLIHAAVATPANVADSTVLPDLLHGKETRVWGDQAYRGQRAVIRQHAPKAQDFINRRYRHRGVVDEVERAKNRTKSKVRARGRTFDRGHQAGVRLRQGALSRAEEEHSSPARDLRAGQSVHGAPASAALPGGVVCPHLPCKPRRHPNASPKTAQPPHYRRRLTKFPCPSSMRQPLVQMGYRGGSGGGRWRRSWQSFTLTLDMRSG